MAKKNEKPEIVKEEAVDVPQPRKRKLLHWFVAAGVLVAAFAYFATRSSDVDPSMEMAPDAANQAPQDVLAAEMGNTPPPPEGALPSDPALAGAEEPMPIPPPVTADSADAGAEPQAMEPEPISPEPIPEPVAPAPVKKKAAPKKAEPKAAAKATAKKYTLKLNRQGTKVPAALSKDKVLSYLNKKLDGDKTCIPSTLKAKEVKPFSATVAVSKTGSITSVDIKPKLPQAKAITSCLKKKLAGNSALFKGKGKSANKITVALKVK